MMMGPKNPSKEVQNKEFTDLDLINKQLLEMKERLKENIYKAHLLHIDLATQFSPHMTESITSTEKMCAHCMESLEKSTK